MSKNKPLISVIVPTYNNEKTIERCLKSILNQSVTNFEVIVINDGSTDKTKAICKELSIKDFRIQVFNQENFGVSKARNTGIKKSKASYITFVDADDSVEENYLKLLYENIIKHKTEISICGVSLIYDNKVEQETKVKENEIFERIEALNLLIEDEKIKSYPCAKMYKKTLFSDIKFPEDRVAFEDSATIYKVFSKSKKVIIINKCLYNYYQYTNSLSHNLTPIRAYNYLMALIEIYKYSLSLDDKITNKNKILNNTLKRCFMNIKRILRNTNSSNFIKETEHCKKEMSFFLRYSPFKIGFYYVLIRLFIYKTNLYRAFLKLKKKR